MSDRPDRSDRPQRADRHAGEAVREQGRPQQSSQTGAQEMSEMGNGAEATATAQPSNVKAPTEAELRAARSVIAAAKATGVKLTSSGAGGQARIMLTNGESRQAYIVRRWKDGASRKLILAEIKSAGPPHDRCTYQIVFSATKNQEGGPPKTETVKEDGTPVSLVPPPQAAE